MLTDRYDRLTCATTNHTSLKISVRGQWSSLNFIRLLPVVYSLSNVVERKKRLEAIGWISGYKWISWLWSKRTRGFLIKVVHNGFQNFEVYHQDYNTYGSILQNFFIWSYNNGIKEIPQWVTEFFEDMTTCHSSFLTDPHFFSWIEIIRSKFTFL